MVKKKRINRKKVKTKIVKKVEKTNAKTSSDNLRTMSKLEYEQAMMDPRFRAAMTGFNQPLPMNQQLNQRMEDLNKRIGDNNQLTNQISLMSEKANLDKKNAELKAELKNTRQRIIDDNAKLRAEMESERMKREMELMKQQQIRDQEYKELKNKVEEQKRIIQDQQLKFKHKQEKHDKEHQLMMEQMKVQHQQDLEPLKSSINELARKSDLETLQFNAAEEIANATLNKTKAEMKKQLQDEILPLKQSTETAKRELELSKQIHEQDKQLADARMDSVKTALLAEYHSSMQKIEYNTNEIKRNAELQKTYHEEQKKLIESQHQNTIQQMKSTYSPYVQQLEMQIKKMDQQLEQSRTQNNLINELKEAQHKYFTETIKSQFEPVIDKIKQQTQQVKSNTDEMKLIRQQQMNVAKANHELTAAQIQAINQPVIQAFEQQKQYLENQMRINGDKNQLLQKIEDLKTDISVLKQRADPSLIRAHGEEMRELTLRTVPLQIDKRLAEKVNDSIIQYENEYRNVIAAGARALGEEFNPDELGTETLRNKLKTKQIETQKKIADIMGQKEVLERQLTMNKQLEQAKLDIETTKARLEAVGKHSDTYNAALRETATRKAEIETENKKLEDIRAQIADVMNNNADIYQNVLNKFNGLIEIDPYIKKIAQEVSGQENPDPRCLPNLINAMREINENVKQTVTSMNDDYMIPPDVNDTSETANKRRKIQQSVANLQQLLNNEGHDILRDRKTLTAERDEVRNQLEEAKVLLVDNQNRLKQAARFVKDTYTFSTSPKYDDGSHSDIGTNLDYPRRVFPDDGREAFRMTVDNFTQIAKRAGINNPADLEPIIEKAAEPITDSF